MRAHGVDGGLWFCRWKIKLCKAALCRVAGKAAQQCFAWRERPVHAATLLWVATLRQQPAHGCAAAAEPCCDGLLSEA